MTYERPVGHGGKKEGLHFPGRLAVTHQNWRSSATWLHSGCKIRCSLTSGPPRTREPLVDAGAVVPPYTDGFGAGLQQLNWEQTYVPTQEKRHELVLSRNAV